MEGKDPLPDSEAAALVFGYGRARIGTAARWQMQEVVDSLCRVFDYYWESGDNANAVKVAGYRVPPGGVPEGMARIIRQALTVVVEGSQLEGNLRAQYGFELGRMENNYEAAQAAFDRALVIAGETGNGDLEVSVLILSAEVDFFHLRLDDCSAKAATAIDRLRQVDEIYNEELALARVTYARVLMLQGASREAREQMAEILAIGERLRDRYWLVAAHYHASFLSILAGEWDAAKNLSEEGLKLTPQDSNSIISLVLADYETGNFGPGDVQMERLFEAMPMSPSGGRASYALPAAAPPYCVLIGGTTSRLSAALEPAKAILSSPSATPLYTSMARCGLGLQAVIQGDASGAAEQYEHLKEYPGILLPFFWSSDWVLGLLATTMNDPARAAGHFSDALSFCRRAGYRPQLARICCDYADLLIAGGPTGDRKRAASLLDEACAIASELNMRVLLERVQSHIAELGHAPAPAQLYADGLSEREIQVLRLVAKGRSNPGIADELVLSVRTVANHVASILNKTGTSNRTEAASYATRHGLA